MNHEHDTCTESMCYEGMILGPCTEDCPVDDCTVIGHCDCACHSGRTCGCGHTWPATPEQVQA